MIGARLKLARAAADLSLRGLSDAMGGLVTAQAIGKYERDEAMPSSNVLLALTRALNVTVDYLLSENVLTLEGVDFRKKPSTSRREDAQVEARVLQCVGQYLALEEALGLDSAHWEKPKHAPYPVRQIVEAEGIAERLRAEWVLGTSPIANLVELLEEHGLKVICEKLAENVAGMTAKIQRERGAPIPVIIVNCSHSGERQRFTLAHELGHILMEPIKLSENDAEKAAHYFAGAFLMPAETLWDEIGKNRQDISLGELFNLKRILGVSAQAIAYRCKDLGIIGQAAFGRLFDEFKRQGWRDPPYKEPFERQAESAKRLQRLCFRAVQEQLITESRAAEALGISVRDLEKHMSVPWEMVDADA